MEYPLLTPDPPPPILLPWSQPHLTPGRGLWAHLFFQRKRLFCYIQMQRRPTEWLNRTRNVIVRLHLKQPSCTKPYCRLTFLWENTEGMYVSDHLKNTHSSRYQFTFCVAFRCVVCGVSINAFERTELPVAPTQEDFSGALQLLSPSTCSTGWGCSWNVGSGFLQGDGRVLVNRNWDPRISSKDSSDGVSAWIRRSLFTCGLRSTFRR